MAAEFTDTELDTILAVLWDQRDVLEERLRDLSDQGLHVLDKRRILVQVKINEINKVIMKLNYGFGKSL